jgi:hypothetical protein
MCSPIIQHLSKILFINVIFQHPVALVFNYMDVQLPSQVQPYLYVYIDLILRYYLFRLNAIIRYFVSWPKSLHCSLK